jgi:N-acetylmuramoyl-L-alanine amidase
MDRLSKKLLPALLAVLLLLTCLGGAGCGKTEAQPPAAEEPETEPAREEASYGAEMVSLPPAMPATGIGRIMPEVVKQRDILICIDPGHGFEDGGSGDAETSFYPPGVLEKDITIVVANMLNEDLQKRGFQTVMTHDGETIPAYYNWDGNYRFNPDERAAMMNALDPDYIVSIHTNTAGNPDACGVQVYYNHISANKINDWNEPAAEAIAQAIDELVDTTSKTDLRNPENADNASLAVTRETHAAAALIELGFCTNEQDAARLIDPEWQASVADAIAEGIERFFDSLEN